MSLDRAILDTLKLNFVPKEVKEERLKHCLAPCEKLNSLTEMNCNACGGVPCFVKWKTAMPKEFCPIGKWDVYVVSSNNENPTS